MGFTLVELLIVIAILGILYSVVAPSYSDYIIKSRRADVQQQLLQYSAILERQYTRMGGYPDEYTFSTSDYYDFNYTSDATSNSSDGTSFLITASPKGAQKSDECGALKVDQTGEKTANLSSCWIN
ncbi:type IV pilin protein [Pseudoalteromonas sp. MMG010]|nr:type IV pilin protein [Pseudoalteromonas sp. MMG010]